MSLAVEVLLARNPDHFSFVTRLQALQPSVSYEEASEMEQRARAALLEAESLAERVRSGPVDRPGRELPEWRRGVDALRRNFPGVTEEQANRLMGRGMTATR